MTRKARFTRTLADYADRPAEPRDEESHADEPRTICVMEAKPDGTFCTVEMVTLPSYTAALRAADRAQELADEQCQPRRAYVVDRAGVAVYAACTTEVGRQESRRQRRDIANCNKR